MTERPGVDLTGRYLSAIGEHDLLTSEQEVELARRIESGTAARRELERGDCVDPERLRTLRQAVTEGDRARERFLQANLRLVVAIARKHAARSGLDLLDLVQEGNLGLMRAVDRFDWRKGFKFSTYATWWIRQAVHRAIARHSRSIRVPVHLHEVAGRVRRTEAGLAAELGRNPTPAEVARASGFEEERVREVLDLRPVVSLQRPIGEDGTELGHLLEDGDSQDPLEATERLELAETIRRSLDTLPPRDARVLVLRFGLDGEEPMDLDGVGEVLGVTRERVRQIEQRALYRLRGRTELRQALSRTA